MNCQLDKLINLIKSDNVELAINLATGLGLYDQLVEVLKGRYNNLFDVCSINYSSYSDQEYLMSLPVALSNLDELKELMMKYIKKFRLNESAEFDNYISAVKSGLESNLDENSINQIQTIIMLMQIQGYSVDQLFELADREIGDNLLNRVKIYELFKSNFELGPDVLNRVNNYLEDIYVKIDQFALEYFYTDNNFRRKYNQGLNKIERVTEFLKISKITLGSFRPNVDFLFSEKFKEIAKLMNNVVEVRLNAIDALTEIPQSLTYFKSLKILNLSENNIEEIPNWISDFSQLEVLKLSNNEIGGELPIAIGNLKNLKILELVGNSITNFDAVVNCTQLEKINFGYNSIGTIPNNISKLSNLKELFLHYNLIKIIPPEFFKLSHLIEIKLPFNLIEELPAEIDQLTNLVDIELQQNRIKSIPQSISNLVNLTSLDISDNPIEEIPPNIEHEKLTELYISYTPFAAKLNSIERSQLQDQFPNAKIII